MRVLVPYEELTPETLSALVEDFVTRSGAIHGHADDPLESKVTAVMNQLKSKRAVIVFDEENENWTILPKAEWREDSGDDDPDRIIVRDD